MKQDYESNPVPATEAKLSLSAQFAERYETWSPPMRFLLWAGLALILYFGVVEKAFVTAGALGAEADELAEKMTMITRDSTKDTNLIEKGKGNWGPRAVGSAGGAELQRAITSVLNDHNVYSGVGFKDIGDDQVSGARSNADKNDPRVLKLKLMKKQVQFTASADVVTAVLADLEKHPAVACLQRVSLKRNAARKVLEVTLVAQSWNRN